MANLAEHQFFLNHAVEVASKNVCQKKGGPFGAIIVKNHEIIATSGNQVTTDLDPTAHAEILAIRSACKKIKNFNLSGCYLYSSCEPCPMCLGAIYWARLEKVFFACDRKDAAEAGFDDHFIYNELSLSPNQRTISMQQLPVDSATKPFEDWSANSLLIRY